MAHVSTKRFPTPEERDERVKVDLDPEVFIAALLEVEPPADEDEGEDAE